MNPLVHLHRHSEHSLLDGTGTSDQYAAEAARLGQTHLAQTDHGNLSGALHHLKACEKHGIIPISGVEAYFRPDRRTHDASNKDYWHLLLLAKDLRGWHSLLRITSEAYATGFYYKPCVDYDLLERHHEGLMCGTACVSGYLSEAIAKDDPEHQVFLEKMKTIFGDDLFVEIMPHDFDLQRSMNVELTNVAMRNGIPLVATVDAHYPYEDWADTQDVMLMMATGQSLASRKEKQEKGEDTYTFTAKTLFIMDAGQLKETFVKYHPALPEHVVDEAIANTQLIANHIEPFIVDKGTKTPHAGKAEDIEREIREWCEEGLARLAKLYAEDGMEFPEEEYRAQYEHEMEILISKNVLGYIYIIADLVRWAKSTRALPGETGIKRPIRVGAGRGSAAGSLVSFMCRITGIDPIAHGLLFERFLNPYREGLPDIDIDFQHNKRDVVKEYLARRWGKDHVADIISHQTFGLRSAIQGVARVFDVDYNETRKLTEAFDDKTGDIKLQGLYDISPSLRAFAEKYPQVWRHSLRVEGQVKATSKHAAGVVITDKPIADYMPTMRGNDGTTVTAWSQRAEFPIIDEYGFLKIDVLGTDGLTIQDETLRLMGDEMSHDDLDELTIFPWRCEHDVVRAFGHDLTLGVFQFESRGIRGLLKQIRPDKFGDISAANALYRPGPLEGGIAFDYGDIKNGHKPEEYWHEAAREFLTETHGLMVYQEQVMQIGVALGGFSMGEAALLQKAMTKWQSTKLKDNKGRDEMNKFYAKFETGCLERGLTSDAAKGIWEKVLQFSIYGFNKSHSAGYAAQAYQDMWLKLKKQQAFYAALLTYETAKVPQVVREAMVRGTKVLPPNINMSRRGFVLDGDAIRFGLEAVKYVGDAAIDAIVEHQPFKSRQDFLDRVPRKKCNQRVRDALERCGALDVFDARDGLTDKDKAANERELLGFGLSSSSMANAYRAVIQPRVDSETDYDGAAEGTAVTLGGEVIEVTEIKTKRGQAMAFVDVANGSQQWSCTLFPPPWIKFQRYCELGTFIMARGNKDDRGQVLVHTMCSVEELIQALEEENGCQ